MKERLRNIDTEDRAKRSSTHLNQVPGREESAWDKINLKKNAENFSELMKDTNPLISGAKFQTR